MNDDDNQLKMDTFEFDSNKNKALIDEIKEDPLFQMISNDAIASRILLILVKQRRALWINRIAEYITADYNLIYRKIKLLLSLGLIKRIQVDEIHPNELIVRSIDDAHEHGMRTADDFRRATWLALSTADEGGERSNEWWINFLSLLEDKYKVIRR